MPESGVTRTVRQRGVTLACVGYAIQFVAMTIGGTPGKTHGSDLKPMIWFGVITPVLAMVALSLSTFSKGIRYKKTWIEADIVRGNHNFRLRRLQFASLLFFIAGKVGPVHIGGSLILYLVGAATSFIGNNVLVSSAALVKR